MPSSEIQSGGEKPEGGSNLFRQLVYRKYYQKYVPQCCTRLFFGVERTRNATALREKSRLRAQMYAVSPFALLH